MLYHWRHLGSTVVRPQQTTPAAPCPPCPGDPRVRLHQALLPRPASGADSEPTAGLFPRPGKPPAVSDSLGLGWQPRVLGGAVLSLCLLSEPLDTSLALKPGQERCFSLFFFFFLIYLFLFGCAASLLVCKLFSSCSV